MTKTTLQRFIFLSIFLIGFMFAKSQTNILTETMGTGGSNGATIATWETNNYFDNDGLTMSGTGDMRNTSTSTGYSGASGTWNVMLNASTEYFQISGINTSSYTNLSLSFGLRKGATAENGSTFSVQVSSDGTNWTNLSFSALPTGTGTAIWYLLTPTGVIPSVQNLTIKFVSSSTTEFRVDDVKLTGTLAPSLSVAESSVPAMSTAVGTPVTQDVTVSGSNLTGDVTLAVSGADAAQFSVLPTSITPAGGSVSNVTATVKYNPTVSGNHTATLTISSPGAADVTRTLTGSAVPATPGFTPGTGTYTSAQSVTLSNGSAADKIYYTTDGSAPTSSSTLYDGTPISVNSTTTIKAVAYDATNTFASAVASATYTFTPSLSVAESSVPAMSTTVGTPVTKDITVSGSYLTADVTLAISGDNADQFSVLPTSITPAGGSITNEIATVKYNPTGVGTHTAVLTISSPGAADVTRNLSGTATAIVTGFQNNSDSKLMISKDGNTIKFNSISDGGLVEVYNSSGGKIMTQKAVKGLNVVNLYNYKGLIVIRLGNEIAKVIL